MARDPIDFCVMGQSLQLRGYWDAQRSWDSRLIMMLKSQPLCTGAEMNLRDRVLGAAEKNSFIALPSKGGPSGLLPSKTMCPNLGGFDEEFYSNSSRVGLLTGFGCVQDLWCFNLVSGGLCLLILMSFSGPFNLASGGFLAAPPLISNCLNLPFGTQGRSWRLEFCLQETGDKKGFRAQGPQGSFSVSVPLPPPNGRVSWEQRWDQKPDLQACR